MKKWFFVTAIIIAAITLAVCTSSGGGKEPPPPPPEGAERIVLENGAYAIFRFDLPPGTTWANYSKITVDYMVDERNLRRPQRNSNNVRLMGNYRAEQFEVSGSIRNFNMEDGARSSNGPYIMDNTPRTFATMGAVADEWFTVEYDISGSKGHQQFVRSNVPAPTATGSFYFGIGIPAMADGSTSGIVQYVKNVTLHHASDPSLNVVSKGSGFDEPTFVSFFPVLSSRSGPPAVEYPATQSTPVAQSTPAAQSNSVAQSTPAPAVQTTPTLGQPTALQQVLNALPTVPIAGQSLQFRFGGDYWIATLNGRNFLAGIVVSEDIAGGSILRLQQTHTYPPRDLPLVTTTWIRTPGPEIVLEHLVGPPAILRPKT